jgi:hypothetical protein
MLLPPILELPYLITPCITTTTTTTIISSSSHHHRYCYHHHPLSLSSQGMGMGMNMGMGTGMGSADAPGVEWLFEPPRHLSFPGSFQESRSMARDDKKWMLVNIQSHEEFSSQMLNRDTWTDETVISLLRTSFVFWQRGHTSPDAQAYMRTHSLTEADLPHIAVIDTRTGAKIVTVKGFLGPGDLAMALLEFLENNNFEGTKAPRTRSIDMTREFERNAEESSGGGEWEWGVCV